MNGYGYIRYRINGSIAYVTEDLPEFVHETKQASLGWFSLMKHSDTYTVGPFKLRYKNSIRKGRIGLPVD